ncbi:uncharacterized protein [Prorops nasuta]|uniref:uncharacterized protein isoform X1 n=1 Tax=Prorops nasuta TaxID=863751 RepID=UPI0034CFD686
MRLVDLSENCKFERSPILSRCKILDDFQVTLEVMNLSYSHGRRLMFNCRSNDEIRFGILKPVRGLCDWLEDDIFEEVKAAWTIRYHCCLGNSWKPCKILSRESSDSIIVL